MLRFQDRRAAGRALARLLSAYASAPETFIVALPRGGVPVAFEIALALALPLRVFLVRKVGYASQPELALGAVASGGVRILNDKLLAQLGLTEQDIEPAMRREMEELARCESAYAGHTAGWRIRGQQIIVVDDGVATGASMRAALAALKAAVPARIIVAVPVGAADTVHLLRDLADDVVCLNTPTNFTAVGEWYDDFSQTTDAEVAALLAASPHTTAQ
ncbi:MAG: phosphoribosyltransferase [Acidobacteriaceae bacterium]